MHFCCSCFHPWSNTDSDSGVLDYGTSHQNVFFLIDKNTLYKLHSAVTEDTKVLLSWCSFCLTVWIFFWYRALMMVILFQLWSCKSLLLPSSLMAPLLLFLPFCGSCKGLIQDGMILKAKNRKSKKKLALWRSMFAISVFICLKVALQLIMLSLKNRWSSKRHV